MQWEFSRARTLTCRDRSLRCGVAGSEGSLEAAVLPPVEPEDSASLSPDALTSTVCSLACMPCSRQTALVCCSHCNLPLKATSLPETSHIKLAAEKGWAHGGSTAA